MLFIIKNKQRSGFNYEEQLNYEVLEALLNSHESLNIYRYSYQSYLGLENVVKLLILDKSYAKSLCYQFNRIKKDIYRLPIPEKEEGLIECKSKITKAFELINNIDAEELLVLNTENTFRENFEATLSELSDLLHETAILMSSTYFDHSFQQTQMVQQKIEI